MAVKTAPVAPAPLVCAGNIQHTSTTISAPLMMPITGKEDSSPLRGGPKAPAALVSPVTNTTAVIMRIGKSHQGACPRWGGLALRGIGASSRRMTVTSSPKAGSSGWG